MTKNNDSATEQSKRINDVRRLLETPEVKLHKTPTWLNARLRAYRKKNKLESLPTFMLLTESVNTMAPGGGLWTGGWLDHWGTCAKGPFSCCNKIVSLVSEPYGFGSETAKNLDAFCEALDLTWHVSSNTWWNPGYTARITIHPKGLEGP